MNESTIRLWWDIFKGGKKVEIRAFKTDDKGRKVTASGYFDNVESIVSELTRTDGENYSGVYFTLNSLCNGLEGKPGHTLNRLTTTNEFRELKTTGKNDIAGRDWVLIDLDPIRPSDINSTDEEFGWAKQKANEVIRGLREYGFRKPVVCLSGNGVHLLYKTAIKADSTSEKMLQTFYRSLNALFGDEHIKIDPAVADPNRICRLYGTMNRKGADTTERPQRESGIVQFENVDGLPSVQSTPREFFEKVASLYPTPQSDSRNRGYNGEKFNLQDFFDRHGIEIHKTASFGDGTKYVLEHCPFNSEHRAPDSAVFEFANGALGFTCLHASCSDKTWRDFRLHFEPDAYDRPYEANTSRYDRFEKQEVQTPVIVPETAEKGKKWLSPLDIELQAEKVECIPSGIKQLDELTGGFELGDTTIMTGNPASGKTTLINEFILNAVESGYKVACWSGELIARRFMFWLHLTAARYPLHTKPRKDRKDSYYIPDGIARVIDGWLNERFYLYNNDYGNNYSQILSDMNECAETFGTKLFILDNLSALTLDFNDDDFKKQTSFINSVKDFGQKHNAHIIVVIHPRKPSGHNFLRKEDIKGVQELQALVCNILLMHRCNQDFFINARAHFGTKLTSTFEGFDNVLEIGKNRTEGLMDKFIGLYFEKETRRYLENRADQLVYGWENSYKGPVATPPPPMRTFEVNKYWETDKDDEPDMPDFGQ